MSKLTLTDTHCSDITLTHAGDLLTINACFNPSNFYLTQVDAMELSRSLQVWANFDEVGMLDNRVEALERLCEHYQKQLTVANKMLAHTGEAMFIHDEMTPRKGETDIQSIKEKGLLASGLVV